MEKTDKELVDYGIKMLKRGDGYRSILTFLRRYRFEEREIDKIIERIKIQENNLKIEKPKSIKNPLNLILALIFIIGGIFLTILLSNKGYFSLISIGISGIGLMALAKADKDIFRQRWN